MTIITDDNAFSAFLIDAPYAAVKFHSEKDCPDCERMLPIFKSLEKEPDYGHTKFGTMNADNNPAAEKLISSQRLPFVAVYKNSLLVEGTTVVSEDKLRAMLNNLNNAKIIL